MSELSAIAKTPFYLTVSRFIERTDLFRGVCRLHLAYSGGADSTALLAFLATWVKDHPLTLTAHHIRHGLRPSDAIDAAVAEANARRFDVPFFVTELNLGNLPSNVEATARLARLAALEQAIPACHRHETAIITAHHGDENIETALWRIGRGCGLEGLSLAPRTHDAIVRIRPLLCTGRSEIVAFLEELGLSWAEDPTNAEDHYRRNRLRHRVLPSLRDEFGNMSPAYRSLVHLHSDGEALSCFSENLVTRHMIGNCWIFPTALFDTFSVSARCQLLRHAARHILCGYCPDTAFVERTCRVLSERRPSQKVSTDQKIFWTWNRHFVMGRPHVDTPPQPPPVKLPCPCTCQPVWDIATVSVSRLICVDPPKNTRTRLFLDASACLGECSFVPANAVTQMTTHDGRTARLTALLRQAGIPDVLMVIWPVLVCGETPLWILSGPRSAQALPPAPNRPALCIDVDKGIFASPKAAGEAYGT